ncbi:BppU family phage baseplate upper protein [Enterococcus mediterraneensis]|uniref:BppU family phage baseplate upper protein n=1 Tax=Enterococcus mediterraneensis TaxID=2364791 RepID=UPI000F0608C4|nr:BppU family phage baseplate upper protein [Enterococcus mediterraneensis]
MANEKVAKFIIDVSAESKRTFNSSVRFFSKDHRTAKFLIQAEKDKVAIPKSSISQVEILFESIDMSHSPNGKVIFNDNMTVESDGLFSYVLPDELLNYSGLMAFEVYIYYTNGDETDSSNRIVYDQRVSAIDRVAGQVELVYIKDMETAKREVAEKAAEVKLDMDQYQSGLDDYRDGKISQMDGYTTEVQAAGNTALETINQEAGRLGAHADQKITEYDQKFQQTEQNIATLDQNYTELRNGMKLSEAWAWNKEGTDRFTKVYPQENVWLSSNHQFPVFGWDYSSDNKSFTYKGTIGAVGTFYLDKVLAYAFPEDEGVGRTITVSFDVESKTEGLQFSSNQMYINSGLSATRNKPTLIVGEKVRVYGTFVYKKATNGTTMLHVYVTSPESLNGNLVISGVKVEQGENANPIYTPAPSEDYANAYPQYRGLALVPSDLPEDYAWEESAERIKQLAQQETDKLKGEVADIQNWIAQQGGTA